MSTAKITAVFDREAEGAAAAIVEGLAGYGPRPVSSALHLATRSAYSIGIEIGLAIALADPAAGRRIQTFLTVEVQRSDPRATAARDEQAANWIAASRDD